MNLNMYTWDTPGLCFVVPLNFLEYIFKPIEETFKPGFQATV